nr:hypothetical protein [Tanacetum cinerariifolium]
MRTYSSSNLHVESPPNPSTSNPKRRNRRHSKQPFILEESPIDTMADQRTMAELLRAPTEGYAEAIVVPSILAEQFELKHSLVNMMTSDHFFGLEKDNPRDHIRCDANSNSSSEIAKLAHAVNQQTSACLAADGNTFPELRDNIQGYVAAAVVNYNQAIILKKLPEKLRDPGKLLISCSFSELKYKALADLARIARDVFVPVGKFTFPSDFVIVVYESDPIVPLILGRPFLRTARALIDVHGEEMILREDLFATNDQSGIPTFSSHPNLTSSEVKDDIFDPEGDMVLIEKLINLDSTKDLPPTHNINPLSGSTTSFSLNHLLEEVPLILGRPFLRTARALIDVHGEEMVLRDGDERLTLNMRHDTSSYSNQPQKESINVINIYDDSRGNVLPEKLLDLDSIKGLHPPHHVNQLSSSTTSSSSNQLLEEFADELVLITFPLEYDDDLPFDIESNLKEIEYIFHHDSIKDMDSILWDSIDQIESDIEYVYDDHFDSKGEKIKESKLLIEELDLPSDFLPSPKYDSFLSEDFSKVDDLPSTNNKDKVFNLGILIQVNLFKVITRLAPDKNDKKLAIFHASSILKDFDPPLYELPFFK